MLFYFLSIGPSNTRASNLAKYDLFFFLTRCWKIDLACLFMNSLSLYHNILHHTITLPGLGALPIVWGKAFVAALCNLACHYILHNYTYHVSQVNLYLASPLSILAYTSVVHPSFTSNRRYMHDQLPDQQIYKG